jgi:hypothetical protein
VPAGTLPHGDGDPRCMVAYQIAFLFTSLPTSPITMITTGCRPKHPPLACRPQHPPHPAGSLQRPARETPRMPTYPPPPAAQLVQCCNAKHGLYAGQGRSPTTLSVAQAVSVSQQGVKVAPDWHARMRSCFFTGSLKGAPDWIDAAMMHARKCKPHAGTRMLTDAPPPQAGWPSTGRVPCRSLCRAASAVCGRTRCKRSG